MLPISPSIIADIEFIGPFFHNLVQFVVAVAPLTSISVAFGIIVALVFPRRLQWPYAVSALLGFLCYHVVLWWQADPNVWSWRDPITSEVYQFMPAVLFCVAPALLGTLIVRLWLWRHAKRI